MPYNSAQFAEKYQLALQTAQEQKPSGGLNGYELEWNLLDEQFRPLLTVGSGPAQQSFVDYLRAEVLPPALRDFSQLEVFHWMVEFATRPYFSPRGAVYEARLMEATLVNALAQAGGNFGENLFYWHGNLLFSTEISHASIPGNWSIAKRRYLERCVDLYGGSLATAGIHVNLSLPDPLFTWDFMLLPVSERGERHLDQFKSEFYITATRLMRAFAALFIATSASTPLQSQVRGGRAVVVLTENDSVRNLTFPNPPEIDQPDLYRSYKDYKRISYDLVRRGVRFGNNNWTPIRARSFAEPVERLISVTSDQLSALYTRGLFAVGEASPPEDMARQIEEQNLLARINLPMGRVEVRTDDGGHALEVDQANLTLKHLLLIRFYADPQFARSFRYDREDIQRARSNEQDAACFGLRAGIENPLTGKPAAMRDFLKWTLEEVRPLAEALDLWDDLAPLVEMSAGAPNTAERLRQRIQHEIGDGDEVPLALLQGLVEERRAQVAAEIQDIALRHTSLGVDAAGIGEFLQYARQDARQRPELPVRFQAASTPRLDMHYADKTAEILDLAQQLIRIPSVTACPEERLDEVHRAATFICDYLRAHGFEPKYFDGKYPAVFVQFPPLQNHPTAQPPILLSGHFDVVAPDPDDSQFTPRIEGDYLWGRGAADMKTVAATCLVWMKDMLQDNRKGDSSGIDVDAEIARTGRPNMAILLVGNEENGEAEAWGTPHVLKELGIAPALFIAGERTGEKGDELFGEICTENRGVMRFEVFAQGAKGHSALAGSGDLGERLLMARAALGEMFVRRLTLKSADGWQSQAKFPFINVGTPGMYNVTADEGILGVEIRPVPQDDVAALWAEIQTYCAVNDLQLRLNVMENGVACSPENPALLALIEAVRQASGEAPKMGRKLPGTSARFAPAGQAVVWGQTGIGPHARDERHFIPSIEPYYQALGLLAKNWQARQ
jgi:succinyl-diaminopimelate desuccinylase